MCSQPEDPFVCYNVANDCDLGCDCVTQPTAANCRRACDLAANLPTHSLTRSLTRARSLVGFHIRLEASSCGTRKLVKCRGPRIVDLSTWRSLSLEFRPKLCGIVWNSLEFSGIFHPSSNRLPTMPTNEARQSTSQQAHRQQLVQPICLLFWCQFQFQFLF